MGDLAWARRELGCGPDATRRELRDAYLARARELHPDRAGARAGAAAEFARVQRAWEALCGPGADPALGGDARAAAAAAERQRAAHVEVDLDDLRFDEAADAFLSRCRCGDDVAAPTAALDAGVDTFSCATCSLRVRVAYERVE